MFASFSPMVQKKSLNFSVRLGLRLTSWLVYQTIFYLGELKNELSSRGSLRAAETS